MVHKNIIYILCHILINKLFVVNRPRDTISNDHLAQGDARETIHSHSQGYLNIAQDIVMSGFLKNDLAVLPDE
jgi:hypothetical protein